MPSESYAFLLNVWPSNLVLLKTYNNESDDITTIFTDQNSSPLGIEDKVNLKLLDKNKNNTLLCRTKNENICHKYGPLFIYKKSI